MKKLILNHINENKKIIARLKNNKFTEEELLAIKKDREHKFDRLLQLYLLNQGYKNNMVM